MEHTKLYRNVFTICLLTSVMWPCLSAAQTAPATKQTNSTSLADYIDQNQPQEETAASGNEEEGTTSWVKSGANQLAKKVSQVFNNNVETTQIVKRSNASVFDISGIMLRMDKEQVLDAMQKRGYKKTSDHMEIPNFIRWRYEEQCRNQGIVGYERIANCVILLAKKNNYQYVQKMNFSNFQTKESIEVHFTSNFTGNKVYRVMYNTQAANILGSGAKAEYLRNIKIFDFWKKINQKYGHPDNKEEISWGLGDKKPSLKAATGRLILEDPMLLELDYTRMSREDQKFMNTAVYTF